MKTAKLKFKIGDQIVETKEAPVIEGRPVESSIKPILSKIKAILLVPELVETAVAGVLDQKIWNTAVTAQEKERKIITRAAEDIA